MQIYTNNVVIYLVLPIYGRTFTEDFYSKTLLIRELKSKLLLSQVNSL